MSTNQSLARGLDLLLILDGAAEPLGIRELARSLGVGASIAQRLVNTLTIAGFLEQITESRRYRLGHRAMTLGSSRVNSDLLLVNVAAELERLASLRDMNGYFTVLQGSQLVYLHTVQSRGPIQIHVQPGAICTPHSTAMGKAVMATLSAEEVEKMVGVPPYPAMTAKTITDPDRLAKELARVRANGVALSDEEHVAGVLGIGAAIRDARGRAAGSISVAFIRTQIPRGEWNQIGQLVREAAQRCSTAIGYDPRMQEMAHGTVRRTARSASRSSQR